MGLFKTPKRKEVNIESILNVVENESIPKSKIKLRGTSLLAKLKEHNVDYQVKCPVP